MFTSKAKQPVTFLRTPVVILLALFMISSTWIAIAKVASPQVEAATNSTVNFQARLLNNTGSVVPDGNYNVEFKLYDDATTGTALWTETRTTTNRVRVVNGYLTVNLGSVDAFTNINWDQELWLTMNIGGTAGSPTWDGEMTPRLKLTAVPYAMRAGSIVGGSGANTTRLDAGTPSGNNLLHLPAESGTLCVQGSAACGFATGAAGDYIQNQNSVDQTASLRISGSVQAGTLLSTLIDTPSAAALNIGGTATTINLNENTAVAGTLTVSSGLTSLTGATSGDALSVNNSTSTGNIAVFKDNGTAVATIADGGGATFKNSTNTNFGFEIQDSTANPLFRVDTSNRKIAIGAYNTASADNIASQLQVLPISDTRIGLNVKGYSGTYSANYIEAQDSSNNYIFRVQSSGNIQTATGVFVSNFQSAASTNSSGSTFGSGNASGATSNTGVATLKSGDSTTSGNTGAVTVISGAATLGNSGSITVDSGTASGTNGIIYIGTNNTPTINIGGAAKAQTINIGGTNTTSSTAIQSGTGNISMTTNGASASVIAKSGTNSTTAFQVQNASNVALFNVDTSGNRISAKVNTSTVDSMPLLVQQSGAGDAGIEIKGTANSYNVGIDASDSNKFKISSSTASASSTSNFGITDSTGTNDSGNHNMIVANKVTSNNAGTLSSISIYINALDPTNRLMQVGIYADATNKPGVLLANTASQTLTTGWNTFPISTPISGVTTYWLAYETNGSATQERFSTGSVRFYSTTYGTWNSNLTAVTADAQSNIQYIMYGTVTSGGTSDNYNRSLLTLSETGQATFQNSTNSSSAFQIQNAAGQNLLQLSSTTNELTLGTVDQDMQLNMTGDLSWGAPLTSAQGFESVTFPATSPATWTTGSQGSGSSAWTRVTTDYQSGVASAASGATNNVYGASWMDLNYTFASSGTISFYWKVSSEAGYDPLMFCLDNDDCDVDAGGDYQRISGEVAWTKVTVPVTAGAHSFRWVYARDDSGTGGSNKAWLDNVQFTAGGGTGTIRGDALTFVASDSVTFQAGGNTSALVVSADGKVGIGTAAPTEALTVIGDSSVKNSAGTKAYRTRTSGSAIDVEAGGANLYFSTWSDAALSTGQRQHLIMYSASSRMDVTSGYTYFNPTSANATGSAIVDINTPLTGQQDILRFAQGGSVIGYVRSNGSGLLTYQTFTGGHGAWTNQHIEPGMLVTLTGENRRQPGLSDAEPIYGIVKTTQPNDPKVLGNYFGGPIREWSFEDTDSVTAVGNGFAWVTEEGGNIDQGDDLMSSSLSGYAMKDTGEFVESHIFAKASDKVDWSTVTDKVDGKKVKKVSVLYGAYTRLNATGLAMGLANGSIVSNDLEFTGMVTFSNAVTFKSSTTFEGLIKVSSDTAGTVKIPAGQTSAAVTFTQPYLSAPKITTGTSEFVDIAVDNKTNNGFTVRIPNPRGSDTYVDWTAFQTP